MHELWGVWARRKRGKSRPCKVEPPPRATIVAAHDGSRVLLDRQNPRVEITITEMEEADNDEK